MNGLSTRLFQRSEFHRCKVGIVAIVSLLAGGILVRGQVLTNAVGLPVTTALPETGASIFRVFGALIFVIALFLGGVWLFRNWQRFAVKRVGGAKLSLIEAKSLGQRQTLYVVGYQQQRMLLAASPAGITLVSHLPTSEETETKETRETAGGKMTFAQAFQNVLSRKQ